MKALASKNQTKMSRKQGKRRKGGNDFLQKDQITEQDDLLNGPSSMVEVENGSEMLSSNSLDVENSVVVPSRSAVLQACTVTSGFMGFLGVLIRQVLTSLEPLDYLAVAFIPGITEELLFRGALLPLLGTNFTSIFAVAGLFGVLHLGSGRKYSFAVWATFVGFVYGYTTVLSSSIVVPMASHALNNLVGGIIWRYTSNGSQKIE